MPKSRLAGLMAATILSGAAAGASAQPMLGFSQTGADAQRALEARFDANLSADAMRERLKLMAAAPNHVGSPHNKANAEYTLQQFKSWGWDAHIERFDVLYPTPLEESLELLGPKPYKAKLTEPALPEDPDTATGKDGLPPYVAYQGDGDVTAPLVYVNYGMPDDYKVLERMGVSVKGKIVIARYGGGWRGLKPKLAQEHGAIGCLIYSDPADDGYGQGAVYPDGAWRPAEGVQRGSVADMPTYPGDPTTPGVGSTKDAKHLSREEAITVLKIPALPISYGDAQPLLEALGGDVGPRGWRGSLGQTYRTGPSQAQVHLVVKSDWSLKPLYDVIATLKGKDRPDEWVVRGNHRDGWVIGAFDPLAGHVAMMEEAKSMGAMVKAGWRPSRTIVYASWDGEEPGLLGSTEWAETHADELKKKAILYLNTDTNGRGPFGADASYSTQALVNQVVADVTDPETKVSAQQRALASLQVEALAAGAREDLKDKAKEATKTGQLPVDDMGSGSDYTPFVQHLGIASINFGYGGEDEQGGVYHSLYDTFEHFDRFGDPGFGYQVAMAQTAGRIVMRTAQAEVAPFRFTEAAERLSSEVDELKKLADKQKDHAEAVNKLIDQKAFALADDPTKKWNPPARETPPPLLDFKPLEDAAATVKASAAAYDTALAQAGELPAARRTQLNAILREAERALTDERGLPGRPWFKNMAYAPGMLTGYGAKTLPGVREAIESRRWEETIEYIGRTAETLRGYAAQIDKATAALKS
jgi:N-acetylated-alpha-linked acidic dipeptidase